MYDYESSEFECSKGGSVVFRFSAIDKIIRAEAVAGDFQEEAQRWCKEWNKKEHGSGHHYGRPCECIEEAEKMVKRYDVVFHRTAN